MPLRQTENQNYSASWFKSSNKILYKSTTWGREEESQNATVFVEASWVGLEIVLIV